MSYTENKFGEIATFAAGSFLCFFILLRFRWDFICPFAVFFQFLPPPRAIKFSPSFSPFSNCFPRCHDCVLEAAFF